eukprot:PLAT848.1.p1 GENE.PLAT848.1~~PLAT848.1.p1  ORF type:complete len:602 (+),score=349.19 PLAT848.1:35-1807(+)
MAVTFGRIWLAGAGSGDGSLIITKPSLTWNARLSSRSVSAKVSHIAGCTWTQLTREMFQLCVVNEDETSLRFSGFSPADKEALAAALLDACEVELVDRSPSCSGYSWGEMEVEGDTLQFTSNGAVAAELALEELTTCALPGRNELELLFIDDNVAGEGDDTLVGMRLYVPPVPDDETAPRSRLEALHDEIKSRTSLDSMTGAVILHLEDKQGTFLTPRGRYSLDLTGSMFKMHGKTYTHTIAYKRISRLFLLPRASGAHTALVISLDDSIRQGGTSHSSLVLQMPNDDIELELALSSEQVEEHYKGKLLPHMAGKLPQLIARVFKVLTGKKVYVPGSFRSDRETSSVTCALRTSTGALYPLERSFLFIHKPTTYLRYSDIASVEFQRYAGSSSDSARSFDLHVICKSVGGAAPREFTFSSIERSEYSPLCDFLQAKKLTILNLRDASKEAAADDAMLGLDDDDEDDDDFDDEGDSDFGSDDESERGSSADESAEEGVSEGAPIVARRGKKRGRDEEGEEDDDDDDGGDEEEDGVEESKGDDDDDDDDDDDAADEKKDMDVEEDDKPADGVKDDADAADDDGPALKKAKKE